jgi:S-adenosylmethionine decarboxylase
MLMVNEVKVGYHMVININNVNDLLINNNKKLIEIFEELILMSNLNVLNQCHHEFKPHGLTGLYLLSESHLSYHTWPEHNKICLDLFTCGDKIKYEKVKIYLSQFFSDINIFEINR